MVVGDVCLDGVQFGVDVSVFSGIEDLFSPQDLLIGNVECALTTSEERKPYKWATLKASPSAVTWLRPMNVAVLANNHVSDFGQIGADDTVRVLSNAGIRSVGYGKDIQSAVKPLIVTQEGRNIAILAFCCPTTNGENFATHASAGVAPLGTTLLRNTLDTVRGTVDAILVYMHWGCERVQDPVPEQIRLARLAIDWGADAVVGCHSHTIQSYEIYRGRWIFHGLGNYVFGKSMRQAVHPDGRTEMIPSKLESLNRESLVVKFSIAPDAGQGRLSLESLHPVRFGEDNIPRQISRDELSGDIDKANVRFQRYVKLHAKSLTGVHEPTYLAAMRNGILSFGYLEKPISDRDVSLPAVIARTSWRRKASIVNRARSARRALGKIVKSGESMILAARIGIKWRVDRLRLPLTSAHRGLYDKIHRLSLRELGEFPDIVRCRDFNDKIQWLKLFDQSADLVRCSDKILVKEYIRERVGDAYLPQLYQVKNRYAQVEFEALPKAFVIKTNHDSGTVILVQDKFKLDRQLAEFRIETALRRPYGSETGEWAYSWIRPKVFVEELLDPERKTRLADYKWHCVNGKVRWLQYFFDRDREPKETIVFPNRSVADFGLSHNMRHHPCFDPPCEWGEMIKVAEALSTGFKYVRVDMYLAVGKLYVGELTFYPWMGCYKGEGQRRLGQLLDFDRTSYKPPFSNPKETQPSIDELRRGEHGNTLLNPTSNHPLCN